MKKDNFKCPVCGSDEVEETKTNDSLQFLSGIIDKKLYITTRYGERISVVVCKNCGIVYKPKIEVME